jgi:hypothetical protein
MQAFHVVAATPALLAARTTELVPREATLRAPAPNPVQAMGDVKFTLPASGRMDIDLYSVTGRRVGRIASGWFEAGAHTIPWRGVTDGGTALANGVYFVRLKGVNVDLTQKLVIAN